MDIGPSGGTPPNASSEGGFNWQALARGLSRMGPPLQGPPSSARFNVSTRPAFIYTNPVAARQASEDQAQRFGLQSQEQANYQNYLAQLQADKGATERSAQATEAARLNEQNRLGAIEREGAAGRASNERIAGMQALLQEHRQREATWVANEQNVRLGTEYARTKNARPDDPSVNSPGITKYITYNPDTKQWESIFKSYPRPQPPNFGISQPGPSVPTEAAPPETGPAVPSGPPTAAVPPTAPASYNMAAGIPLPETGAMAYHPYVLAARAARAVFPYTPTGWVMNRITGAFQPVQPAVPVR
jgi:hypothetical protein